MVRSVMAILQVLPECITFSPDEGRDWWSRNTICHNLPPLPIALPMTTESPTSWTVIRSSTAGTVSATKVIFVDGVNLRPDFSFEVKVVVSDARDLATCARGHPERLWRKQYVSFCRLFNDAGSDLDCVVKKCRMVRERKGFGSRRSWYDVESEYSDWEKPDKYLSQPMIRWRLDKSRHGSR
jgi:hypothetical protein